MPDRNAHVMIELGFKEIGAGWLGRSRCCSVTFVPGDAGVVQLLFDESSLACSFALGCEDLYCSLRSLILRTESSGDEPDSVV